VPEVSILLMQTVPLLPPASPFPPRLPAPFYIFGTMPVNMDNIEYISSSDSESDSCKLVGGGSMYCCICCCVFYLWMCPRCGVYTWSSGLISQWIDHMTCEVSWAYNSNSESRVMPITELATRRPKRRRLGMNSIFHHRAIVTNYHHSISHRVWIIFLLFWMQRDTQS
jgi:hypothetical protein